MSTNKKIPKNGTLGDLLYYARQDDSDINHMTCDWMKYSDNHDRQEAYNIMRNNYLNGKYKRGGHKKK